MKELLQSHREGALNAGKKLAAAFAAAASSGYLRDNHEYESTNMSDDNMSDDERSVETTEDDIVYETDDDSSLSEEDTDSEEDEYASEGYECDSAATDDSDDGTFVEHGGTISDSDGDTTYSLVEDDIRTLVDDFHGLMKEILERNSTLCLIQFMLNKRAGKENDGPSLVRAMLPWPFSIEDRDEAGSLLELDSLSVEY